MDQRIMRDIDSRFRSADFVCADLMAKLSFLASQTGDVIYGTQFQADLRIIKRRIESWQTQWRERNNAEERNYLS